MQASRAVLLVNVVCACALFLVAALPLLVAENVFGRGWTHGEAACQLHRWAGWVGWAVGDWAGWVDIRWGGW